MKNFLIPLLVIVVFFLSNPEVVVDLRTFSFDDGTYSHSFLLPFVIVFLLWQAVKDRKIKIRISIAYFVMFIFSLIAFLLVQYAHQYLIARVIWPSILIFALLAIFKTNKEIVTPLCLLWFITPIWGIVSTILQSISVFVVTKMMRLTDIPTFVEGNFVHIPSGILEIAEGCSGLRYVLSSMILTIIYSLLYLKTKKDIIIFLILALLGSMLTNWIRIFLLILIGHYTEMQSSLMADHNSFGWFIYLPFIVVLFYLGSKLENKSSNYGSGSASEFHEVINDNVANKKISFMLFCIFSCLFFLSGNSMKLLSDTKFSYSFHKVKLETSTYSSERKVDNKVISPSIFSYENKSEEVINLDYLNVLYIKYSFSGHKLGEYSDFYLNNFVPDGWVVQSIIQDKHFVIMTLRDKLGNNAAIKYWHQVANFRSVNRFTLLLHRLNQAIYFNRATELSWYFTFCKNQSCSDEINILRLIE